MIVNFEIPKINNPITVAIGTFDGLHSGHRAVLENARKIAEKNDQKLAVLTFLDHPSLITGSKKIPSLLTTPEEKIEKLEEYNVDLCVILPFSTEISQLSPEDFIKSILCEKLNASNICVGFNFFFGNKASGNGETLIELGGKFNFKAEITPPVLYDDIEVSSTLIRNLLRHGEIKKSNILLGYEYFLKGEVIRGKGIGKSLLGTPTANIHIDPRKQVPKNGVYSCEVIVRGKKFHAVTNIGNRPTFNNGGKSIEVHILDFSDDIYGEIITTNLKTFIRDEIKFEDFNSLKLQISDDIEKCQRIFNLDK